MFGILLFEPCNQPRAEVVLRFHERSSFARALGDLLIISGFVGRNRHGSGAQRGFGERGFGFGRGVRGATAQQHGHKETGHERLDCGALRALPRYSSKKLTSGATMSAPASKNSRLCASPEGPLKTMAE